MFAPPASGTPWQPPSCSAASIMTTLVLTAINTSLLEQRPAPESCVRDEYDFVVVGGGSAGCVLASRLSENPDWSVLLLEAGGEQPEVSKVPGFHDDVKASALNWKSKSEPQGNGVCQSGCGTARGNGLGGGSAINGMLYSRGNKADFHYWNNTFWTFEQALPFFKKSENNRDPDVANDKMYHSTGGPLSVQRQLYLDRNVGIFLKAMEELGLPEVDFNGASQLGRGVFQMTMSGSERASTNSAFLDPVRDSRKNLFVETKAFATRVLLRKLTTRAYGVKYRNQHGTIRTVYAKKEVVLSAGALATPQLLLLSGVGPADHLDEMGIPVVVNLPVGENLQDHVWSIAAVFQLNGTETEPRGALAARMADWLGYRQQRAGPLTGIGVGPVATFRRSAAQPHDDPRPYIQYTFVGRPGALETGATCTKPTASSVYYDQVVVAAFLLHPRSRGRVRLNSTDPLRPPRVLLSLLEDEQDVAVLAEGMRWLGRLAGTEALLRHGFQRYAPNGRTAPELCWLYNTEEDDRLWECLARAYAGSGLHYVASCRIGDVVDERLRVKGVRGLRVADASVIPLSPSGNTNAPTIMVAERAACIIRSDHTPGAGEVC